MRAAARRRSRSAPRSTSSRAATSSSQCGTICVAPPRSTMLIGWFVASGGGANVLSAAATSPSRPLSTPTRSSRPSALTTSTNAKSAKSSHSAETTVCAVRSNSSDSANAAPRRSSIARRCTPRYCSSTSVAVPYQRDDSARLVAQADGADDEPPVHAVVAPQPVRPACPRTFRCASRAATGPAPCRRRPDGRSRSSRRRARRRAASRYIPPSAG